MSNISIKSFQQPEVFEFSPENKKKIESIIKKYPEGKQASAVMPLLDMAQLQHNGWIPEKAMEEIGRILDMPPIRVFEVATFYTMYNLEPKGEHHLQVCTTTPCWLSGSADVVNACEKDLGIKMGETTTDGKFSLSEVECLGACVNAPVIQRNGEELYEDLNPENVIEVLDALKDNKTIKHGSQIGRNNSTGVQGATCLHKEAKKAGVKDAN